MSAVSIALRLSLIALRSLLSSCQRYLELPGFETRNLSGLARHCARFSHAHVTRCHCCRALEYLRIYLVHRFCSSKSFVRTVLSVPWF